MCHICISEKIKNTITKNHVLLLTRKVIIHTQILHISLCVGLRTDPLTHSDILGCPLFFPMSSLTLWMSWIIALVLFSLGPAESHLQEEGSHSFSLNQPHPKECIEGSAWIAAQCHSPYWGGKMTLNRDYCQSFIRRCLFKSHPFAILLKDPCSYRIYNTLY